MTEKDLQQVRLVRRWSSNPTATCRDSTALAFLASRLQQRTLAGGLAQLRQTSPYVLGTFERYRARWWQIIAEERGIELQIEEL